MDDQRRAAILLNLARGGTPGGADPPAVGTVLRGAASRLQAAGLTRPTVERLLLLRRAGEPERELDRARRLGARVLLPGDPGFPGPLRDHPYGPAVLYARGHPWPGEDPPRVALVGARAATPALKRFTFLLGQECGQHRVLVVSGLARGIDAAAHAGCLAGGGFPVGVLGCGLDRRYPRETAGLHAGVQERGILLSTYPFGSLPKPFHFPLRNRIIAALALRVVVVQASEDSGSMITAKAALEIGTEVCAVPGSPDDPLARGSNRLIRDGASPILEPADLLEPLLGVGVVPHQPMQHTDRRPLDLDTRIRLHIGSTPLCAEEIARAIGTPLAEVLERLMILESRGAVERLPGRLFRNRERR